MRVTRTTDEKYTVPAMEEILEWQELCLIVGSIILILAIALNWL